MIENIIIVFLLLITVAIVLVGTAMMGETSQPVQAVSAHTTEVIEVDGKPLHCLWIHNSMSCDWPRYHEGDE